MTIKNKIIQFVLGASEHPETGEWYSDVDHKALQEDMPKRYWWRTYIKDEVDVYEQRIEALETAIQTIRDNDCGAWLDSKNIEKRGELMQTLDNAYRVLNNG